ncbi:hypothetical protein HUA74_18350 [Myxococcus sp. CA051A]|uniref:hypothetical protein n=1 Tax=Myxococcus sp. CA051A TaxID=2741739 RepID=UPI00157AD668|nr:hypothetical protein [Myxococcus sp. CA051A]NTX62618.1 hypothetical protein [Myxococcus sp. CA051A]
MLTQAQRTTAEALLAKVADLLKRAEEAASPRELASNLLDWVPSWTPLGVARDLFVNDVQKQIIGALSEVKDRVPSWRGERWQWAQSGVRATDGKPYAFAQWIGEGDSLASTLATAMGEIHAASTWEVTRQTATETVETVADAGAAVVETAAELGRAVVGPWPWWVKAALVVGGAVVVTGGAAVAWQGLRNTPLGLALRGAAAVAKASPLGTAARAAGTATRAAIERTEAQPAPKPRLSNVRPAARRGGATRPRAAPKQRTITINVER